MGVTEPSNANDGGGSPEPQAHSQQGAFPNRHLSGLEAALGYTFKNPSLLTEALVHKSYLYAVPDAPFAPNERLEFLGDAVLGLLASSHLFSTYPDVAEGRLSALRGALVRLNTLAEMAAPLELGEYMYMSRGEEMAGGRTRPGNLGRVLEAVLGAVYLDGGLEAAGNVWTRALGERSLEQMQDVLKSDYKSALQQEAQATLRLTPRYELIDTSGPDHAKIFTVRVFVGGEPLAEGKGTNKQIAEQEAAREALPRMAELAAMQEASADSVRSESDPSAPPAQDNPLRSGNPEHEVTS